MVVEEEAVSDYNGKSTLKEPRYKVYKTQLTFKWVRLRCLGRLRCRSPRCLSRDLGRSRPRLLHRPLPSLFTQRPAVSDNGADASRYKITINRKHPHVVTCTMAEGKGACAPRTRSRLHFRM